MAERLRRLRGRRLLVGLLGAALALAAAAVALGAPPEIAASDSTTAWAPNTATINVGESVNFKNTSTTVPHGVHWEVGNPETPTCDSGVKVETSGTAWSGSCTFNQGGTYSFRCFVHAAMTGTVTVNGPAKPTVSTGTGAPSSTDDTKATLHGEVNPQGQATTYFFKYGTTASYGSETPHESAGAGTGNLSKSAPIEGLSPRTTYHFRIVATNESGTSEGADKTFTTFGPPLATTEPATEVGGTGAKLMGTVNPEGHATKYFFEYGESTSYGQKTGEIEVPAGTTNVSASQVLSGLSPQTTYHFRLVAKNSSGETPGVDKSLMTLALQKPVVTTGQATGVGETAATLAGTVNPEGQETTYLFEWGTTTAYGQKTGEISAGKGSAATVVSAALAGLLPDTPYHFRLVAKNGTGESLGADQAFTTSPPAPPQPPPSPSPITPPPVIPTGPPLGSGVTVVAGKHGAPVRVSVQVLESGAGGRLEVDLLLKGGSKRTIAGRLVRRGVSSGKLSVQVPLNAKAKGTLRKNHRLALMVKIKLTPPAGAPATATRSVVVRG